MKYLGDAPENLFARIRRLFIEKNGKATKVLDAATGQPDQVPPLTLRKIVAEAIMDDNHRIHTYWDNDDPGKFCENFIRRVANFDVSKFSGLKTLILPGEKSMLPLLPIACGAKRKDSPVDNEGFVRTVPSYDLLETWADYIDAPCTQWPLFSEENFRLNLKNLKALGTPPRMIVVVKPGNPCPVGASREEWLELIAYCIENNIRLVNDGAYSSLIHKKHVPLSHVASEFPKLEWMELFSLSKALSACGWRLGAAVGSADFVDELAKIKANADSGPFGPALVGAAKYFESDQSSVEMKEIQQMYDRRLKIATQIFVEAGFKLACETDAGFFMLFHCPKKINGEVCENNEAFNLKLMEKVDVVGVPWAEVSGTEFIRFSACIDFEDEVFVQKLRDQFAQILIEY